MHTTSSEHREGGEKLALAQVRLAPITALFVHTWWWLVRARAMVGVKLVAKTMLRLSIPEQALEPRFRQVVWAAFRLEKTAPR